MDFKITLQEIFEESPKKYIPTRVLRDRFPFSRYEEFLYQGKVPFVKNILKRTSILKDDEVDRKFYILNSLKDNFKELFESSTDYLSGGGNFPMSISYDSSSEEMALGKILTELQSLHEHLKIAIEHELEVL